MSRYDDLVALHVSNKRKGLLLYVLCWVNFLALGLCVWSSSMLHMIMGVVLLITLLVMAFFAFKLKKNADRVWNILHPPQNEIKGGTETDGSE